VDLTPAPARPPLDACSRLNVDDLMSQSADQYSKGFAITALAVITKALACKQTVQMYRRAAIYACAAHDAAGAERYNSKLEPQYQSAILQRCQQEGIYLHGGLPSKNPGGAKD